MYIIVKAFEQIGEAYSRKLLFMPLHSLILVIVLPSINPKKISKVNIFFAQFWMIFVDGCNCNTSLLLHWNWKDILLLCSFHFSGASSIKGFAPRQGRVNARLVIPSDKLFFSKRKGGHCHQDFALRVKKFLLRSLPRKSKAYYLMKCLLILLLWHMVFLGQKSIRSKWNVIQDVPKAQKSKVD